MIFVTVGTHEQPFDRLVKYVDDLVAEGIIQDKVVIQTGFCAYEPKHCICQKLYPYQEMNTLVEEARIVITHGGPSSFILPLQKGKVPIVVPRRFKYNEHVNDHQVKFVTEVSERMKNIIAVVELEELSEVISNYDTLIKNMHNENISNNTRFNIELEKIVNNMFAGEK